MENATPHEPDCACAYKKDADKPTTWRYALSDKRDLRIDFMRGIALVMMVVAHTEVMSIFNIFTWERFGLVTGAEGFVILSGFMLGMLNRVRLQKAVLLTISWGFICARGKYIA